MAGEKEIGVAAAAVVVAAVCRKCKMQQAKHSKETGGAKKKQFTRTFLIVTPYNYSLQFIYMFIRIESYHESPTYQNQDTPYDMTIRSGPKTIYFALGLQK